MVRACRVVAVSVGLVILAWQAGNAWRGRLDHPYLIADLIVAALLIGSARVRDGRAASVLMIGAFSSTAGVFLAATTAAIHRDGYSVGRLMAGLGLVPCVACALALVGGRSGPRPN